MQKEIYRVIKTDSDKFVVEDKSDRLVCNARNKNKKNDILAGDFVKVVGGVIEKVIRRKNRLSRPQIANIDQVIFVVCSLPKIDYFLLDKAIVNCLINDIEIIICVNKEDINKSSFLTEIRQQYIDRSIISASALSGDVEQVLPLLPDKLTCLSGQSAVGKSTIINALLKENSVKTADLSSYKRGKNTTTSAQLYSVNNGYLADTPGFSFLDFEEVKSDELELYYPEFEGLRHKCKYHRCTHISEPECAVKTAVNNQEVNLFRYQRYVKLFGELKQLQLTKYK